MSTLEIWATVLTVACVILATRLKVAQYPVGIIATVLFFGVFWQAQLYSSAWLQVYFTLVQFYGWWYWLKGDGGKEPKITTWPLQTHIVLGGTALAFSYLVAQLLGHYTDAKMAFLDTLIFSLSVVAQFLLDRKKLEHWYVWGAVNIISIWVYASQGLGVTTALYIGLLCNVFVGYRFWRKEFRGYAT